MNDIVKDFRTKYPIPFYEWNKITKGHIECTSCSEMMYSGEIVCVDVKNSTTTDVFAMCSSCGVKYYHNNVKGSFKKTAKEPDKLTKRSDIDMSWIYLKDKSCYFCGDGVCIHR